MKPVAVYSLKRVRVECPDCGSGGASGGPCYCHKCNYDVMMLPIHSGLMKNWVEYEKQVKE